MATDHTRAPGGADYPRKRTAIACEVCRARRSKCDARKPACSKCVELEAECVYRKPNLWDREPVTAAATAALTKFDDRLDQIQDSIAALTQQVQTITSPSPRDQGILSPLGTSPQTIDSRLHYQTQIESSSHNSFPRPRLQGHRLPNLISFVSPASLGPFSYDSSEHLFSTEIEHGNLLVKLIEHAFNSNVQADFSSQTCWRLQRAFVSGFLRWMPIFDDDTCFKHVQNASATQFRDPSPSTCLALLMFAIGSMAVDETLYCDDPCQLPGFQYLALAYQAQKNMRSTIGNLEYLQSRCLLSAYFSFAMRPVQAWTEVNYVSRECMVLLKTAWKFQDVSTSELKGRAYWVAWLIENELEVSLELPSSGIRSFQEAMALPTSPNEEEGLYFFLALISLRKLLAEVIQTIGFKSGHALYVPIVAVELRNQILSWHEHLPTALQFPLDASPLFDMRKEYLRGQLFCLLSVIYWPFVIEYVANQEKPREDVSEMSTVHERAKECLESCILHLKASDGMMMQKSLVSHAVVRAFYAISMTLLLAYQPVYHCPPPLDIVDVIKKSLEVLGLWDKVPFMQEPINRIYCFAADIGILPPIRNN